MSITLFWPPRGLDHRVNPRRQAQEVVPGKVALLAGGFFSKIGKNELPPIIAAVRQLGVPRVLPTYCTSADAVALFHTEYGENYIAGGAGRTVTSSGKELNRVEGSLH